MSDAQEIMNLYCAIVLMPTVEERRKALEKVPEHLREEVKKRVADWFDMRTKRRIASENARLARLDREENEREIEKRRKQHGG